MGRKLNPKRNGTGFLMKSKNHCTLKGIHILLLIILVLLMVGGLMWVSRKEARIKILPFGVEDLKENVTNHKVGIEFNIEDMDYLRPAVKTHIFISSWWSFKCWLLDVGDNMVVPSRKEPIETSGYVTHVDETIYIKGIGEPILFPFDSYKFRVKVSLCGIPFRHTNEVISPTVPVNLCNSIPTLFLKKPKEQAAAAWEFSELHVEDRVSYNGFICFDLKRGIFPKIAFVTSVVLCFIIFIGMWAEPLHVSMEKSFGLIGVLAGTRGLLWLAAPYFPTLFDFFGLTLLIILLLRIFYLAFEEKVSLATDKTQTPCR